MKVLGGRRTQSVAIPIFCIVLSLLAAAIVLLCLGKNPLQAYAGLLQGSGLFPKDSYAAHRSILTDFISMVDNWTPMLFAALAVAIANKGGLFNIGVSGQMLAAGFTATVLIGYSDLPAVVAKPLVFVIGIVVGALVGALIGFLKQRFNINEVVSSIMINYIIQYIVSFFIYTYYVDPISRQSRAVGANARLTLQQVAIGDLNTVLPIGFVLAVVCVFVLRFLMNRTKFGFELKAVGANKRAARYAGIPVGSRIVLSMTISGALGGLAGVTYYLGYYASIQPRTLADMGFDSIAVALLGNSNPVGIFFSSFLITAISKGSTYMSSTVGVQQEIASLITGIILLFSACSAFIRYLVEKYRVQLEEADKAMAEGGKA